MKILNIFFIVLFFTCMFSNLCAQAPDTLVQQIDEDLYKIDNITIDAERREITFPAEFNMNKGLIETILVGPKGRLHETILKTDAIPSYVQIALLLLGLECGQNMELANYETVPEGDSVDVYVIWSDSLGEVHEERIERLVWNVPKEREMQETHWVFLGSKIIQGQFIADLEQNIIRTYHDPFAILHNPLPTITDDTFYEANNNIVPEKGTQAMIKIIALD